MSKTREQWLLEATEKLRPYFEDHQYEIPEHVRVTCGWPCAGGTKANGRVIGQCFKSECATDGVTQVFISPWLDKPVEVLETLVHELIHAVLPEAKHGKGFKVAAKELGLTGRAIETKAGPELVTLLEKLGEELGAYDNARLDKLVSSDGPKPQVNRQLKITCERLEAHEDHESYILRGSKKVLDRGIPVCPLCANEMKREEKEIE